MKKRLVFCLTCGCCLGEERPYYAREHLIQFPDHISFLVKTIFDPLNLENPDEWFTYHIPRMKNASSTDWKHDKYYRQGNRTLFKVLFR